MLILNQKDRNFDIESIKIIKKIEKYYDLIKNNYETNIVNNTIVLSPSNYNEISISLEECNNLKNDIIKMFRKEIFKFSIITKYIEKLENKIFYDVKEAISLLYEFLKLLKTNEKNAADLTLIEESKNCGILSINQKLSAGMKLFEYSITGYYKHLIFEVPNAF